MEKMKYTFKDWKSGKVALGYDLLIPQGEQYEVVTWENFDSEDILLIKKEQKKIFRVQVSRLLKHFKSIFVKQYERSLAKDEKVYDAIINIEKILYDGSIPRNFEDFDNTLPAFLDTRFGVFSYEQLLEIREYDKKYVQYGIDIDPDFIHPENTFKNSAGIHAAVYCVAIKDFQQWIFENYAKYYYIEVGVFESAAFWMREDGKCTIDIREASKFTEKEAEEIQKSNPEYVVWSCDYINCHKKAIKVIVDKQHLDPKEKKKFKKKPITNF